MILIYSWLMIEMYACKSYFLAHARAAKNIYWRVGGNKNTPILSTGGRTSAKIEGHSLSQNVDISCLMSLWIRII